MFAEDISRIIFWSFRGNIFFCDTITQYAVNPIACTISKSIQVPQPLCYRRQKSPSKTRPSLAIKRRLIQSRRISSTCLPPIHIKPSLSTPRPNQSRRPPRTFTNFTIQSHVKPRIHHHFDHSTPDSQLYWVPPDPTIATDVCHSKAP